MDVVYQARGREEEEGGEAQLPAVTSGTPGNRRYDSEESAVL
jgi:hypothetical protein